MKKSWAAIKSKLGGAHRVKQSVRVYPFPQKQVEIDPPPQEVAPTIDRPASEDNHTCAYSVRAGPPRTSLSSLPGFNELKGTLIGEARPTTPPNHTPGVNDYPETAPQRQGSDDSVRSDKAAFGGTPHASIDTATATLNQPHGSLVEIPHVQITPAQDTSIYAQYPLVNPIEKGEVAKLAIPPTPIFTPPHPQGTPIRSPGLFASLLTPSPQFKPQDSPQKSPVSPTNLLVPPSPIVVVPNLGTPFPSSPTTPTTPTTPIMPATLIKHQAWIPAVFGQTPVPQTPALPPRSPNRPPPPGLNPITMAGGERKDFGVIGDRRACRLSAGSNEVAKNQPQLRVVGGSKGKPEREEEAPPVKVEHTPKCGGQEREDRNGPRSQPGEAKPGGIYVGEMKYYVGRYLGGGGMGDVYSVVSKESMNLKALKVIRRKYLISGDFSTVRDEWSVLKAISEAKFIYPRQVDGLQFVQNLLESWYDKENIYFVLVCSTGFVTSIAINNRSSQPLCVYTLWGHLETAKFDSLTIRVYAAELVRSLVIDFLRELN